MKKNAHLLGFFAQILLTTIILVSCSKNHNESMLSAKEQSSNQSNLYSVSNVKKGNIDPFKGRRNITDTSKSTKDPRDLSGDIRDLRDDIISLR